MFLIRYGLYRHGCDVSMYSNSSKCEVVERCVIKLGLTLDRPGVVMLLQERVKSFRKEKGNAVLGQVTVDQAIGGMRGIPVRVMSYSLHLVSCICCRHCSGTDFLYTCGCMFMAQACRARNNGIGMNKKNQRKH